VIVEQEHAPCRDRPTAARTSRRAPHAAGYVMLEGEFFRTHRAEILDLVKHRAAQAQAEPPVQRLMALSDRDGGVLGSRPPTPLARGIGEAVKNAYQGSLRWLRSPPMA